MRSVGTAELKKFKEVWQKYDIYSTGSIGLKHLIPFVEGVGDPVGRSKCSLMWSQVLRAEIAAIPGAQTSGEISFRNLFLILTTKMQGADAICEDVDGGIKTNIDQVINLSLHCSRCRELNLVCIYMRTMQVRSLGAVQAMFSQIMFSQTEGPTNTRHRLHL